MKKILNLIKEHFALKRAKKEAIKGLVEFSELESYYREDKIKVKNLVVTYVEKIKVAADIEEVELLRLDAQELIDDIMSIERRRKAAEFKAKFRDLKR